MPVIDVHSHFVPTGLPDMAARHGDPRWPVLHLGPEPAIVRHGTRYRAVDAGYYDIDRRVEQLDLLGIDLQVLSPLPVMLPFWADPRWARDVCTAHNELLAEACARHPARFLALGIVPLQDPALAATEVARVRELGLAGLEFGTWIGDGRDLADDGYGEVFAAAADAGLPVLLHPNAPDTFGRTVPTAVDLGVAVGCETARAMATLHLAGTLHTCPGLRLCLAHGGGAYLWLWPRFRGLAARAGAPDQLPDCLHVDTAGLAPANLDYLGGLLDADRVLFGSDMPATAVERVGRLLADVGGPQSAAVDANVAAFLGR